MSENNPILLIHVCVGVCVCGCVCVCGGGVHPGSILVLKTRTAK